MNVFARSGLRFGLRGRSHLLDQARPGLAAAFAPGRPLEQQAALVFHTEGCLGLRPGQPPLSGW